MLGFEMTDAEFEESEIPFDVRQIMTGRDSSRPYNKIIAAGLDMKNQIKELQKSIMIERTEMYNALFDAIKKNLHVQSGLIENFDNDLRNDIIAYLGIKAYIQYLKVNGKGNKLEGLDNALIYDAEAVQRGPEYSDIIDAVQKMREII